MKIPIWVTKAAANPVVQAAGLKVAEEIATYGLIGLIDKTIDEAALHLAKRIHERETQNKQGETDESV